MAHVLSKKEEKEIDARLQGAGAGAGSSKRPLEEEDVVTSSGSGGDEPPPKKEMRRVRMLTPPPKTPPPQRVIVSTIPCGGRDVFGIAAQRGKAGKLLYLVASNEDTIYVLNLETNEITRLAGSGEEGAEDGVGAAASFNSPTDAAVDAYGIVVVADYGNHKVRKVTPEGRVTTLAGSGKEGAADGAGGDASFRKPSGVAVDREGCVYVADSGNHKIRKITRDGVVTTLAGSGEEGYDDGTGADAKFSSPMGLGVDKDGNVYVADRRWSTSIRMITPGGVVTTLAVASRFDDPRCVDVDSFSNVYLGVDHQIMVIDPHGNVTTLAGTGYIGKKDGMGSEASFGHITSIRIAPEGGALFVTAGGVVRKVECESIGMPAHLTLVDLRKDVKVAQ